MRILKSVPSLDMIIRDNPEVQALIFDMDGTLLNTEPLHAKAHLKLIDKFSKEKTILTCEIVEREYRGLSDKFVYEALISENIIPKSITQNIFFQEKNDILIAEVPSILLEDIFDLEIKNLILKAKSLNKKIALVTASEQNITHSLLKHFDLFSLFDLIKTNNDFIKSKPHPMPYLLTIEELNLTAQEVVIFEDSKPGVASAIKSHAPMYKVEWYNT